jgi:hypothetical protein
MKITGVYAIFVGLLMIAQWGFFIMTGQVPELQTAPFSIAMHLTAEFGTAAGLIISGWALLNCIPWGRNTYLLAAGMLAYSVITSSGYFTQQGQTAPVVMFAILLFLTLVSTLVVAKK